MLQTRPFYGDIPFPGTVPPREAEDNNCAQRRSLYSPEYFANLSPTAGTLPLRNTPPQGIPVGPSARASKMLAVQLKSAVTVFGGKGGTGLPRVAFEFEVRYR